MPTTPDTFTLEVTISGLCVFLPKAAKMHVLIVGGGGHDGGHAMERHYPRVFYDAAYDNPDSSVLAVGAGYSAVSLEDRVLDLATAQAPGGTVEGIPKLLLDLSAFTPVLPDPETAKIPNLGARVTLPPGTAVCPDPQGAWELRLQGKKTQVLDRVAWHVVWTTTGMDGTSLSWRLDSLNDFPGQPLRPLYPKGGYIKLLVSHVPLAESKPGPLHRGIPPLEGTPMPHFHAFRDLFDLPASSPWPEMVFVGPREIVNSTAYTCVPSGGH
jgi:hypothetical protein